MSTVKARRLDTASTVFTWLFVAECCVKLAALGPHSYFHDQMNSFDFIVVLLSLVDTFTQVRAFAAAAPCV